LIPRSGKSQVIINLIGCAPQTQSTAPSLALKSVRITRIWTRENECWQKSKFRKIKSM